MRDIADKYGEQVGDLQVADLKQKASNVMGYYDGANIAVNSKYFSNDRVNAAMDQSAKDGFHPSRGNKSGMEALVAHEAGHMLADRVEARTGTSQADIVKGAKKSLGYSKVAQVQSRISKYATHNYHETIAEAFTDVYCNGGRASRASRAVVNELNKYFNL